MKKWFGLGVILLVLILGSYYVTGMVTETTLKKNLYVINQTNGLMVDVESYQRGWFTSQAEIKWRLHIPERVVKKENNQSSIIPAQDYALKMPVTVFHGPIIVADKSIHFGLGYAQTQMALPDMLEKQFANTFTKESIKPRVLIHVLVNYLNRSQFGINVPEFTLIPKDGTGEFKWLGMNNDIRLTPNMSSIAGETNLEGMYVFNKQVSAALGKINSDYNLYQSDEGLYLGEANFGLDSFIVKQDGQVQFDVKDVDAQTSSQVDNQLLNSFFNLSIERVAAHGKVYGPGVLKVGVKNLDAVALAEINKLANKMQQGTDADKQQALVALLPAGLKLVSKGPEFEVSELSLTMPEGQIEGELSITLPKGESSNNPFQLLSRINGQGKLSMPVPVLRALLIESTEKKLKQKPELADKLTQQLQASMQQQPSTADINSPADDAANQQPIASDKQPHQQAMAMVDKQLSDLVQAGLLVKNNTHYTVDIKLTNGQFIVNGQTVNPADLKF